MIKEEALENAEFLQTNMEEEKKNKNKTCHTFFQRHAQDTPNWEKHVNGNFGQLLETRLDYSEMVSWGKTFLKGWNKMTHIEESVKL